MDLAATIAQKQQEADQLSASIDAKNIELTEKQLVIGTLQNLAAQPTYSVEDINYLISVGAI